MSDLRTKMLRIASNLPQGDPTRRELLSALSEVKPYKFQMGLTIPNEYWRPEMEGKFLKAIQKVLQHGVVAGKFPVGEIKGGTVKIQDDGFYVNSMFYPASIEETEAAYHHVDNYYTRRKMWPINWTLSSNGGFFTQVHKALPEYGMVLDIDWYAAEHITEYFR